MPCTVPEVWIKINQVNLERVLLSSDGFFKSRQIWRGDIDVLTGYQAMKMVLI